MPSVPPFNDAQVREAAAEVLRRAPYAQWREREVNMAWLEPLLAWLRGFDGWLFDLSISAPVLYWLIVLGALLTATLLLAHVVWSVRVALSMPATGAPPPARESSQSLAAGAEALAADGRFLDAAHRLQLAIIELLLRQRVIALTRSEPNRVLRERLRVAPLPDAERRTLLALVDRLEASWFRDRANDASLYDEWRELHARLCAAPGGVERSAEAA
jgi:hypothetical protein